MESFDVRAVLIFKGRYFRFSIGSYIITPSILLSQRWSDGDVRAERVKIYEVWEGFHLEGSGQKWKKDEEDSEVVEAMELS